MNLSTLCDQIALHPEMKARVLSFAKDFDFAVVDAYQEGYWDYGNMSEALAQTKAVLGADTDGVKILACMLKAAADTHDVYREKGISDEIYFDTMRCFSRFVQETLEMKGALCFDRAYWTPRQVGCHLFRIGALEYEIKPRESDRVISIHIPSDADFSPSAVGRSLADAKRFFAVYDPTLSDAEYQCHSWLLDEQLKTMLRADSKIVQFQNRFEIYDAGEAGSAFLRWVYCTDSSDYAALPEDTSLQINMKKHLLAGGVIRNSHGRIKE